MHNSDLVIVAARSAMGKTAFLLNMVAANNDRPLLFSTEQSRIQAGFRFFSIYGNEAKPNKHNNWKDPERAFMRDNYWKNDR